MISGKKTFLVYLGLTLVCFIFIISSNNPVIKVLKDIQNTIFYPFRLVVRGLQHEILVVGNILVRDDTSAETIKKLTLDVENYKQKLTTLTAIQEENDKLKQLLEFKKTISYGSIVSQIISRDFAFGFSYITLNKGRIDGVVDNLPVIAFVNGEKSLVGIVVEATLMTSRVRTVKSDLFNTGAYLPRVDIHSVIRGIGGYVQDIELLYIDKGVPVEKGDLIYTSASSFLFPPNILIGKISSIDNTQKTAITYKVFVEPAVHFNKVSEVFVLKSDHGVSS